MPEDHVAQPVGCGRITNSAVTAVAAGCPQLTSLNLWGCKRITNEAVKAVAAEMPAAHVAQPVGCWRITNAAVTAVRRDAQRSRRSAPRVCEQITDAAVTAVAEGCPQLTSLNLHDCRITDGGDGRGEKMPGAHVAQPGTAGGSPTRR